MNMTQDEVTERLCKLTGANVTTDIDQSSLSKAMAGVCTVHAVRGEHAAMSLVSLRLLGNDAGIESVASDLNRLLTQGEKGNGPENHSQP